MAGFEPMTKRLQAVSGVSAYSAFRSAILKVHYSEGPLFRRFTIPIVSKLHRYHLFNFAYTTLHTPLLPTSDLQKRLLTSLSLVMI